MIKHGWIYYFTFIIIGAIISSIGIYYKNDMRYFFGLCLMALTSLWGASVSNELTW